MQRRLYDRKGAVQLILQSAPFYFKKIYFEHGKR